MALDARNLHVSYGRVPVLKDLSCLVPEGMVTAIIGANASGKSTLLRTLARLISPAAGSVLLDGEEITRLSSREVARRLGFLPQSPTPPEGLTIGDLVERGRYPHRRMGRRLSREDARTVAWALEATRLTDLRERPLDTLSGGQRQRAWIAMALAQDTRTLLLDEPTTHLDLAHQYELLELLAELNTRDGRTITMVLHDVNQASRYAGHLVAVRDGTVVAAGTAREVLTADLVESVLGLPVTVIPDPETGTPLCVPRLRARDTQASPDGTGAGPTSATTPPVSPSAPGPGQA